MQDAIPDPSFRQALAHLDSGNIAALQALLTTEPGLIHRRVTLTEHHYFRNPTLLAFLAENPVRRGTLPANIVPIAQLLLDSGARHDPSALDETLNLVCSGRVTRECRAQLPLIDLLCRYGARPDKALPAALVHGEFEAVHALLANGAALDLPTAAALGRTVDSLRLLPGATPADRHRALALAAQFGRTEIVRALLDSGEDPNRYNPPNAHSHSTPLHQAALANHRGVVQLLLERGARTSLLDTVYQGTPEGWARHAGHHALADLLHSAPNAR